MRALFQSRWMRLILACASVLALALVVWRETSNFGIARRVEGGPSDRAIVYGISNALFIQRSGRYNGAACDLTCAAQFDIQIEGVSKRQPTDFSSPIVHYDVRASYLDQDGQRQHLTVHFWSAAEGLGGPGGWQVGEPLVSRPIHIVVDDSGLRYKGID